jgi:hypothetical protein
MKRKFFIISILVPIVLIFIFFKSPFKNVVRNCPDAMINYVHAIKMNDISYTQNYEANISKIEKGKAIGEVNYMLSGNACADYQMKNGNATLLPKGTKIYEVKGYDPNYRLMADGQLYEASENPNAKTLADFYDIEGRVQKISFESTIDGSHIRDFSKDATKQFMENFFKLDYVGTHKIYKENNKLSDENRIFLRVYLKDQTSFRLVFWLNQKVITPGAYATDRIKEIVVNQKE